MARQKSKSNTKKKNSKPYNTLPNVSLVLAILSLLVGWVPIIGWIVIISAVTLGVISIKKTGCFKCYISLFVSIFSALLVVAFISVGFNSGLTQKDVNISQYGNTDTTTKSDEGSEIAGGNASELSGRCSISDNLECTDFTVTKKIIDLHIKNTGDDISDFNIQVSPKLGCVRYKTFSSLDKGTMTRHIFLCTNISETENSIPLYIDYTDEYGNTNRVEGMISRISY